MKAQPSESYTYSSPSIGATITHAPGAATVQPGFWNLDIDTGVTSTPDYYSGLTSTSSSIKELLVAEKTRLLALKDAYGTYQDVNNLINPPTIGGKAVPLNQKQTLLDHIAIDEEIVKARANYDLTVGLQRALEVQTDAALAKVVTDAEGKKNFDFPAALK